MPDENSGGNPPGESPNNPAPVNQGPMASSSAADAQQQIKTTKDLAKDVHWITHATFWSQVCLGIIGLVALWIYHSQLDQMRIATEANTKATQLAEDSFEINDGDFDRMMTRTIDQTSAQMRSAEAAKKAADTAAETLHVSERAYIQIGFKSIDFDTNTVWLSMVNTGHIPAGPGKTIVHEVTLFTGMNEEQRKIAGGYIIVETHWTESPFQSYPSGESLQIHVGVPALPKTLLMNQKEESIIVGEVIYNDGFPHTKEQIWPFCHVITSQPTFDGNDFPCDPSVELPIAISEDGYPNQTHKKPY